ncbi:nuclease-related domain-containing protein [Saccharothrix deserti]|uniref:nuclease-related domain-containing protein n=1 Tax=Saccharothrix deserti TaxID=2593674 RepID=UPI003B75CDB4
MADTGTQCGFGIRWHNRQPWQWCTTGLPAFPRCDRHGEVRIRSTRGARFERQVAAAFDRWLTALPETVHLFHDTERIIDLRTGNIDHVMLTGAGWIIADAKGWAGGACSSSAAGEFCSRRMVNGVPAVDGRAACLLTGRCPCRSDRAERCTGLGTARWGRLLGAGRALTAMSRRRGLCAFGRRTGSGRVRCDPRTAPSVSGGRPPCRRGTRSAGRSYGGSSRVGA